MAAGPISFELPREIAPDARIYLRPHPVIPQMQVDHGSDGAVERSLAGGPYAFSGCEVLVREGHNVRAGVVDLNDIGRWKESLETAHACAIDRQLENLTQQRPVAAGLSWGRPLLMGVINTTPDSFYGESQADSVSAAIDAAHGMIDAGADIIDVGGESTRPGGARPVTVEEELARVIPVVQALSELPVPISLDTRHARVMAEGVAAGAALINDINALIGDGCLVAATSAGVPVILMHCPADFETMHQPTGYDHVALDVFDWLERRIDACLTAGLSRDCLIVDPGIGFVKQAPQSVAALARVSLLHGLGCPILVGASRKSFIGRVAGGETADDRLPGSLAAALWAAGQGVQILRVHDVAETRQAITLQTAIETGLVEGSQPFHCTMARPAD